MLLEGFFNIRSRDWLQRNATFGLSVRIHRVRNEFSGLLPLKLHIPPRLSRGTSMTPHVASYRPHENGGENQQQNHTVKYTSFHQSPHNTGCLFLDDPAKESKNLVMLIFPKPHAYLL